MSAPGDVLADLAAVLRDERSVISALVADPPYPSPALGRLSAGGTRATRAPGEYALLVESVREGYLLHYGSGRIVAGADPDLALLAGDYLYALGLERLAGLGDLEAVRMLSDLISLAAQIHDGEREPARAQREASALWLAVATSIGAGASDEYGAAIASLRGGSSDAEALLRVAAERAAARGGTGERLKEAADALESAPERLS